MMSYKGYLARVVFDDEAAVFHGEVVNLRDVVTFQGKSVAELRRTLKDSVEDYLEFCRSRGEEPEKPFSGKFLVRVSPELHQRISQAARLRGESLNAWVEETLACATGSEGGREYPRTGEGERTVAAHEPQKRYRRKGGILDLFGTVAMDPGYTYKAERVRKKGKNR